MQRLSVVAAVVLLHLWGLWALQQGLLHRGGEWVVPVMDVSEAPEAAPPLPATVAPKRVSLQPQPQPSAPARPLPVAAAEGPVAAPMANLPSAVAPLGVPSLAPGAAAPVAAVAAVNTTPAPTAKIALPSTQADYLNNPKPAYPALSRRLGEQGRTVVRVLIGADGQPQQAELQTSSGFDRLDRAALETVMRWRYVPGKRGEVPEAMWFNVPINFVLE